MIINNILLIKGEYMKPNYFSFYMMITLFCFSTIAMEQPSKKNINSLFKIIAQLQDSTGEGLDYVDEVVEEQYRFTVIQNLPKSTTKESEKRTYKIEL